MNESGQRRGGAVFETPTWRRVVKRVLRNRLLLPASHEPREAGPKRAMLLHASALALHTPAPGIGVPHLHHTTGLHPPRDDNS